MQRVNFDNKTLRVNQRCTVYACRTFICVVSMPGFIYKHIYMFVGCDLPVAGIRWPCTTEATYL